MPGDSPFKVPHHVIKMPSIGYCSAWVYTYQPVITAMKSSLGGLHSILTVSSHYFEGTPSLIYSKQGLVSVQVTTTSTGFSVATVYYKGTPSLDKVLNVDCVRLGKHTILVAER